jgi:hypothetical protein
MSVLENLEMSAFQRKDRAMCTIGRALMAQPNLLKLDEPRWVLRRSFLRIALSFDRADTNRNSAVVRSVNTVGVRCTYRLVSAKVRFAAILLQR